MASTRQTKTNRRKVARRITANVAGYLWTLTPHGETYLKDAGLSPAWSRRGYAIKIAEAAQELLDIERSLNEN